MTNGIQIFDYKGSAVRTVEKDSEVWFVAKDVCDILELSNPTEALRSLDEDERSSLRITEGTSPNGGNPNVNVINEPGMYKLIFKSRKAEAKEFTRWVTHEVLPQIRETGIYGVNLTQLDAEHRKLEHERIMKDLNLRGAQILQSMIDKELFPLTAETRTVFAHEVFKLVTGHSYLGMLPESTEKWYTATEIGEAVGISANKVGRIAKANGIKAPEGESNEYGRWIFSKSQYSSREVSSFIYTEAGLEWFKRHQEEEE